MSLVKVKHKAQITLPAIFRKALGIQEGDYLDVKIDHNKLTLTPQTLIDKVPETTLSQQGERMLNEALAEVKQGRVKKFAAVEDLLEDLHK